MLTFKRHTPQHGDEHVRMKYLDEIEYFAAKSFSEFLPAFIKRMLCAGKMGPSCRFGAAWSVYKASKGDKTSFPGFKRRAEDVASDAALRKVHEDFFGVQICRGRHQWLES
ncbi:hypothetical protein ACP4OV_031694 [Aristida adscensionis]